MDQSDNFLSRWSRRKLEAEHEKDEPQRTDETVRVPEPQTTATDTPEAVDKVPEASEDGREPELDLTKLPSIESITAESDIRAFLQKGVPAELSRAALRRAWAADPAIRDFIEVAENQWDFVTGSDLPGFGSLDASAEEVRRMVADIFGAEPNATAEAGSPATKVSQIGAAEGTDERVPDQEVPTTEQAHEAPKDISADKAGEVVQRDRVDVAVQQGNAESLPARRAHGRALPQ